AYLLFMVNDFGIHYFNSRTVARHPQLAAKLFPNTLIVKALLAVIYLGLVFVAALVRGFESEIWHLLLFVALNHVLISTVAWLRSNVGGLGMYRMDSFLSTFDKVLLIGICAVLLWLPFGNGKFNIEWFVHAQNLSWALTAAVAFYVVFKKLPKPIRWRPNWALVFFILKKSAPYALAVFLMTAYIRMDIVLLEYLTGVEGRHEAGVYAAAYRLLDALNMAGYLFAGLLLPMFSSILRAATNQTIQTHQTNQTQSLLRLSFQLILSGTVTIAVACFNFRTELMLAIYPKEGTAYHGEVLAWVILTLVPFSGAFIYTTLLTANDSLKKMNRIFLAAIAVNVALNLLLIPQLKAVGAGMSAFFTQGFVMAGMMILAKKELALPFEPRQFYKITAFLVLVCSANWALHLLTGFGWLLKFGVAIAIGLLLAFLLRMVNLKSVLALMKK
ncbi:MAG: polysaccharide biosynthesis C-terminal domain-containing protein, partial [Saprospiraceae bacterium]|nr:polysaccharide biosynthesis C-terminal domain-containing protein [Saprospiraceae bacterium]